MKNAKVSDPRELRFLVTQKCNYKCVFCHKEGLQNIQKDLLSAKDFAYIFKVGKGILGSKEVTLTGGEPLVRKDIIEIAKELKKEKANIVLTTNGFFLADNLELGKYLQRINISIHSLTKGDYESIVGVKNGFGRVIDGLLAFKETYPKVEIRLNSTLIKGVNSSKKEILRYIALAEFLGASIKFVELFPKNAKGFFPLEKVEKILLELGFKKIKKEDRKMDFKKGKTFIRLSKIFCAFAEDMKNPCKSCRKYNDLFVTPEGSIKPCRSQLRVVDILQEVKARKTSNLRKKIKSATEILGNKCPYSLK